MEIEQIDFISTYLYSQLDETIYVEQPPGFTEGNGKVWRLKHGMYGLKQAARQWYKWISEALMRRGFKKLQTDENVFIKDNFFDEITVTVYIDDMKVLCKDIECIQAFKNDIGSEFKINDMGPVSYYLEIKITRNCKNWMLSLSQKRYIEKILETLKMDEGRSVATPGIPGKYYDANPRMAAIEDSHNYLHIIGKCDV